MIIGKFWMISLVFSVFFVSAQVFSRENHESIDELTKCYHSLDGGPVLYSDQVQAARVFFPKKGVVVEGVHPSSKKLGVFLYQENGMVSFYTYPDEYHSSESREDQSFILCQDSSTCDPKLTHQETVFVKPKFDSKDLYTYRMRAGIIGGDAVRDNWLNPKGKSLAALNGGEVLDLSTPNRKEVLLKPLRDSLRKLVGNKKLLKDSFEEEINDHGEEARKNIEKYVDQCLKATHDAQITAALLPYKSKAVISSEVKSSPFKSGNIATPVK